VMKMFLVGLVVMAGLAQNAQAERWGRRMVVVQQQTQRQSTPSTQYSWESGNAYFYDSSGRPISAAEHDRQLKAYRDHYGIGNTATYSTRNNYGTTYGTENNYGTSYKTINNYGNSHTTVNNYGNGRTTVNDYGPGSVTTVNPYNSYSRTSASLDRANAQADQIRRQIDEIKRIMRAKGYNVD